MTSVIECAFFSPACHFGLSVTCSCCQSPAFYSRVLIISCPLSQTTVCLLFISGYKFPTFYFKLSVTCLFIPGCQSPDFYSNLIVTCVFFSLIYFYFQAVNHLFMSGRSLILFSSLSLCLSFTSVSFTRSYFQAVIHLLSVSGNCQCLLLAPVNHHSWSWERRI